MAFGCLDRVHRITFGHLDDCMGVLEPVDTFSERYSAGASRTSVTVKGGRIPVRVFSYFNKAPQDLQV